MIIDAPVSVFHGMDEAKAQIINSAFYGHRVRVWGTKDLLHGRIRQGLDRRDEIYTFLGLVMPDTWTRDVFSSMWDLRLQKSPGILRIISPSLVVKFEVLDRVPMLVCEDCLRFRWSSDLRDFGLGFNSDFTENPDLVSRLCCRDGACW